MAQAKERRSSVPAELNSPRFVRGYRDRTLGRPWTERPGDGYRYERGRLFAIVAPGLPTAKMGRNPTAVAAFIRALHDGTIL